MCTATNSARLTAAIRVRNSPRGVRMTVPGSDRAVSGSHRAVSGTHRAVSGTHRAVVPHGPRRSCGEPTPRRLRGTRGPRADAGPASQAVARPAPSAGGRAGPAAPASAASCVASVAARRPSARLLQGVHSAVSKPNFASKYSLEVAICSKRRLRKRDMEGN